MSALRFYATWAFALAFCVLTWYAVYLAVAAALGAA